MARIGDLLRSVFSTVSAHEKKELLCDTLHYQHPGIDHSLDKAVLCASYPWKELGWDQAHCRYLMGLYYATWPWLREFVNVNRLGLAIIKLWAYDHFCLFGWSVPLPTSDDRSFIY